MVYLSGCETGLAPTGFAPAGRGEEYVSLAQAFLYGKMAKTFAVVFNYPATSGTEPKIAAFVFQYTSYIVIVQAFFTRKMRKIFTIVFTYTSSVCSKPYISPYNQE
jgi:hypothetical protein